MSDAASKEGHLHRLWQGKRPSLHLAVFCLPLTQEEGRASIAGTLPTQTWDVLIHVISPLVSSTEQGTAASPKLFQLSLLFSSYGQKPHAGQIIQNAFWDWKQMPLNEPQATLAEEICFGKRLTSLLFFWERRVRNDSLPSLEPISRWPSAHLGLRFHGPTSNNANQDTCQQRWPHVIPREETPTRNALQQEVPSSCSSLFPHQECFEAQPDGLQTQPRFESRFTVTCILVLSLLSAG